MSIKKNVVSFWANNSSVILTATSVAGVVATAALAVKATPKALDIIIEEENSRGKPVPAKDVPKLVWKEYLPAVAMGAGTVACIIGIHKENTRKLAALAGAYSLVEDKYNLYKAKTNSILSASQSNKVNEEIANDRLQKNPVDKAVVISTGRGDTLCYDALSGRYFTSDPEKIRQAVNEFNHALIQETWSSLNDFYNLLGLEETTLGHQVGWTVDELMDVRYESKIATDGRPCLVIEHDTMPRADYYHNIP